MEQQITLALVLNYTIIFITKGIPFIIGLVSLFRLYAKAGENKTQISLYLPDLIVILACVSILVMNWLCIIGLALICTAIIIMNKLKPDNT